MGIAEQSRRQLSAMILWWVHEAFGAVQHAPKSRIFSEITVIFNSIWNPASFERGSV
jgi:hypothetical protein